MKIKNGNTVSVHYKGTLNDGTEFDNSRTRGTPLNFKVGSGKMIRGFDGACVGMTTGQTKTVSINPADAYGERNPKALQPVPKNAFGPDFNFQVGQPVQGNGPQGPFLALIHALENDMVVLDMNHPLAGKELTFEIEVVSVENSETTTAASSWSATMKKAELLQIAKDNNLDVTTKTTKAKIVEALQAL